MTEYRRGADRRVPVPGRRRRPRREPSRAAAVAVVGLALLAAPSALAVSPDVGPARGRESVGAPAPTLRPQDPPGTTYLYRGVYTAQISHSLKVNWGEKDYDERTMEASIQGTIPTIWVGGQNMTVLNPATSSITVLSASVDSQSAINDGQHLTSCAGSTGRVSGKPVMVAQAAGSRYQLTPFAYLKLPIACTDSDGRSSTGSYGYGPLVARMTGGLIPGGPLKQLFSAESSLTSELGPTACPGYIEGQTPVCSYTIRGTLNLSLIKRIPPKPAGKATLAPGAKKVTLPLTCPEPCTATIRVKPLKGGPAVGSRRLSLQAGRPARVTVGIAKARRQAVKRSGGVRITVRYRLAGGATYTETRKARV